MMRIVALIFFAFISTLPAWSQSELSLYRLNASVPQANLLNPAFYPNHKVVIGLPVISSVYASADNDGMSFRDIFRNSESDSLQLDTVSIFKKLKDTHRMRLNESVQLFYLGLRGERSYFSFGIHQVFETRLHYPGDIIGWATRGPGSPHYEGKPLGVDKFYGRGMAYNKVSVNYTRDITSRFRAGIRFNYLLGVGAGETTDVSGTLMMSSDSISINTGNLRVQTAGVDFFDQDDLTARDYVDYLLKTKNKGMSWDFGATYNITDNVMVSAAVNDIGYIKWKDYTRSYQVNPVYYTFKGFDLLELVNQSPGQGFIDAEVDSLENLYTSTETTGNTFRTSLTGKFYAGINYRLLNMNNFSALVYLDMFQKHVEPAISLGYNLQIRRLINATIGITYQNKQITNIGAGVALKLAALQIYATSDRANSFVYPSRASRGDAHIGANLVFGKVKKKDKIEKVKEAEKETEPEVVAEKLKPDSIPEVVKEPAEEEKREEKQEVVQEPVKEVPAIQAEVKPEVPPVVEEPVKAPEPRHEIVKKGAHPDELQNGNYVVVGAFKSRTNAARYSYMLRDRGHENSFGFASEKNVYYVFVFSSGDLEEARGVRNQYRSIADFQFPDSWVLTVEE